MYMRAGRVKAAVVTLSLDLILGWQAGGISALHTLLQVSLRRQLADVKSTKVFRKKPGSRRAWEYVLEDWEAFWEKEILVLKTL